ncbi:TPA: LPXTG cell wall anchor domain-containing protein, partial [Streptococcus suis]|nr:LPXTG cell wall anchor domain-containing protein [Streptococcus suis]
KEKAEADRLEAERLAREKAEQEAKEKQDSEGSEKPVVPIQPSKPITAPTQPESPSEEPLVTDKGKSVSYELPAINIDELVSDLKVDSKPANTILNPTIQAQTKSIGTAKDAHSNQSGKIKTLPETGTADNLLLSVIGMGLSSLGLVISRREKHSK